MVWRYYRVEPHPVAGHRPPPTTCPTREGSREAGVVDTTKEPLADPNTVHAFSRFMGRCSGELQSNDQCVCSSASYVALLATG